MRAFTGNLKTYNDNFGTRGRQTLTYTISSNAQLVTISPTGLQGYLAGSSDIIISVGIGVYVWSDSTSYPALTLGTIGTGDTLKLINNGFIMGKGGGSGSVGGNAISLSSNVTIDNSNASVSVASGSSSSMSSTTLTIGGTVAGFFRMGMIVTGTGVAANSTITGQLTGTTGGAGTYKVSPGGTVATTAITGTVAAYIGGGGGGGANANANGGGGAGGGSSAVAGGAIGQIGASTSGTGGGGGAGGRIFRGVGGGSNGGGGAGGGGGVAGNFVAGGAGGTANAVGTAGSTVVCSCNPNTSGGGGGGWGASGGGGIAGGQAVALNGFAVTWVASDTSRVWGAVA